MTGPVSEGYPLAGFWVRLGAAFIDGVLIFVVLILLSTIASLSLRISGQPVFLPPLLLEIFFFLEIFLILIIPILYFSLFEASPRQATLGKQVFGLMVTARKDTRISRVRAVVRSLAKLLYLVPLVLGFTGATFGMAGGSPGSPLRSGMALGLINPEMMPAVLLLLLGIGLLVSGFLFGKRGLHDMLAATRVCYLSPAHRDSSDLGMVLAGVLVSGLCLFGAPAGILMVASLTSPPRLDFGEQMDLHGSASARLQGETIVVTWQGGRLNHQVKGYTVKIRDRTDSRSAAWVTYPGSGELYPPDPGGNRTVFGTGNRTDLDVDIEVILHNGHTGSLGFCFPQCGFAPGTVTPGPLPPGGPATPKWIVPIGQKHDLWTGWTQVISINVTSFDRKEALFFPSAGNNVSVYRMNASPDHRFALVGVEFQMSPYPAWGETFMSPLPSSFTLWDGKILVNATVPDHSALNGLVYRIDEYPILNASGMTVNDPEQYPVVMDTLYESGLMTDRTTRAGLLVFEIPDTRDLTNVTIRFCPVNDPAWRAAGYPRLNDFWDCEKDTLAWKLA